MRSLIQVCASLVAISAFVVDPTSKRKTYFARFIRNYQALTAGTESLIDGAAIAANNLIGFYDGYRSGGTIGMFDSPVYWWEAGAAWNVRLLRAFLVFLLIIRPTSIFRNILATRHLTL